jgi:hypothetical protein
VAYSQLLSLPDSRHQAGYARNCAHCYFAYTVLGFSKETEPMGQGSGEEINFRNWLTRLWELASPKCAGQARDPGKGGGFDLVAESIWRQIPPSLGEQSFLLLFLLVLEFELRAFSLLGRHSTS